MTTIELIIPVTAIELTILYLAVAIAGRWAEGRYLWDWPLDLYADLRGKPRQSNR